MTKRPRSRLPGPAPNTPLSLGATRRIATSNAECGAACTPDDGQDARPLPTSVSCSLRSSLSVFTTLTGAAARRTATAARVTASTPLSGGILMSPLLGKPRRPHARPYARSPGRSAARRARRGRQMGDPSLSRKSRVRDVFNEQWEPPRKNCVQCPPILNLTSRSKRNDNFSARGGLDGAELPLGQ